MKILLVYPPAWIRYNLLPPLGIAIVATTLRKEGHVVKQRNIETDIVTSKYANNTQVDLRWILNQEIVKQYLQVESPLELAGFLRFLSCYQDWDSYDVICLSALGKLQVISSAVIAEYVKRHCHDVLTILGGGYPHSMPEKTSALLKSVGCQAIDFIYTYDDAGQQLLDFLKNDNYQKVSKSIPKIYENGRSSSISEYPIPTFDFRVQQQLDLVKSIYGLSSSEPLLQYLVNQGCSSKCSFCTRCQKPMVVKIPSTIAGDLSFLRDKHQTHLFKLECNLINPSRSWLQSMCDTFISKKLKISWNAYAKIGYIDKKLATQLRRAGCIVLRFGVETGSDHVLKILGKGYKIKDVEQILRATKEAGIWNGVLFMLGVPGESEKDIEQTVEFIKRNSKYIDSALVNVFCLLEGTKFFEEPERYNIQIFRDPLTQELCFHDLQSGRSWGNHKKFSIRAHDIVVQTLIDEGIGLTGTCVDLLLWTISQFQNHEKAYEFLISTHPQFLKPYPHHVQRWLLYHPEENYPFPGYQSPIVSDRFGYSGVKKRDKFIKTVVPQPIETHDIHRSNVLSA